MWLKLKPINRIGICSNAGCILARKYEKTNVYAHTIFFRTETLHPI